MLADVLRRVAAMGATVKGIYKGTSGFVTNTNPGGYMQDVSIGATVDTSKSVIFVSQRAGVDSSSANALEPFQYFFNTASQLRFVRDGMFSPSTEIEWAVLEFASGVRVQHLAAGLSSSVETLVTIPIAVNVSRSVILDCGSKIGSSGFGGGVGLWRIANATQAGVKRFHNNAENSEHRASILEFL